MISNMRRPGPLRPALTAAVAVLSLGACGKAGTVGSAGACAPASGGISAKATTASYQMALDVGPREQMLAPGQSGQGEVMLRGEMADTPGAMGSGSMGSGHAMGSGAMATDRHLEVHICSKKTGKVVQDANPVITLTDDTAGGQPQSVPVAVMQGAGMGVEDLHYGNNVVMAGGHSFTVRVQLDAQSAVFHVAIPVQSTGSGGPATSAPAPGGMPGMSGG